VIKDQKATHLTPPEYTVYRAAEPIVIDGWLNEASWGRAPLSRRFVHITTGEPGWYNTQMRLLWDDDYLYAACVAEEEDLFAHSGWRHTPPYWDDPDIELFIDPDNDRCNYYEFQINAMNVINEVIWDYPIHEGCIGRFGWDLVGLKHAVQVDGSLNAPWIKSKGWTVELALPWSGMGAMCPRQETALPPRSGDSWRLNWTRVQKTRHLPPAVRSPRTFSSPREECEYTGPRVVGAAQDSTDWVWAVAPVYSAHVPETWGWVKFSDEVVGEDAGAP